MDDRPHTPDYELLRPIGAGSYGEIWLARSITNAYRAVKVVYRRRFEDERPFEREFRGILKFEPVSRLHKSQVEVLHVGRREDYFYYVMELADDAGVGAIDPESAQGLSSTLQSPPMQSRIGDPATYVPRTLKSELQRRGRLPFDECVRIVLSLTTALEHLHQHGLIHRDIKPSNIIFVGGVPKLADIGLVAGIDATLSFVGTEGFVPPEGPGTKQADIYSLGKVMYEMCTGRDRQEFPELPEDLREAKDREQLIELNEIVLKACERDVHRRYRSAEEMHADLALLQAGRSVHRARRIERRMASAKRSAVVAGAVALLALALTQQSKRGERIALEQVHRMHVAQGVRHLNNGDVYGAVLWFAQALNLGYRNPEQEAIHRLRIGTALGSSPRLSQIVFHDDMVRRAVFNAGGTRFATASDDRTARVWDSNSGEAITPPLRHRAEVRDVEFSPDGRWLVTASNDRTARVWDAATGQPITGPLVHNSYVYRATFHPNGAWVATACDDGTARIWSARSGAPMGEPLFHQDRIQCVRFSPDGEWIATGSRDGTARIWRMADLLRRSSAAANGAAPEFALTIRPVAILRHSGEIQDLAFSADSARCVTGSADGTGRVWNVQTGEPVTSSLKHSDEIWCAAFSPDGRWVATGSKDYTARVWNAVTGEPQTPPLAHGANVRTVEFSGDGRWLATSSSDRTARVWNVADGQPVTPPLKHASNTHTASFDSSSQRLITASRDGMARVWDLTRSLAELCLTNEISVRRVAVSPNGRRLATLRYEWTLGRDEWRPPLLWNMESTPPTAVPLGGATTLTRALSFNPEGTIGVHVGNGGSIELWNAATGAIISSLRIPWAADCSAFSLDGRYLAVGGESGSVDDGSGIVSLRGGATAEPIGEPIPLPACVRNIAWSANGLHLAVAYSSSPDRSFAQVWNVDTRKPVGPPIPHRGGINQLDFSPDGRRLLTAYSVPGLGPSEAQVWDPGTGQPLAPPIRHRDGLTAASFSPDGKWIVTASEDTTARVWDSFTSQPRTPPLEHTAQVQWAEFSPDGSLVLTASYDKTACIWNASTGQPVTSPLRHDGPVWHAAFFKDGSRIATASEDRTVRVWTLAKDSRPVADMVRSSEILAAQRIDSTGGVVPIETHEVRERWAAIRAAAPR